MSDATGDFKKSDVIDLEKKEFEFNVNDKEEMEISRNDLHMEQLYYDDDKENAENEVRIGEVENVEKIQTAVDNNSEQLLENKFTELQFERLFKAHTELFNKNTSLPISRMRYIMKLDPQVVAPSRESVFLITKATESFVKKLTQDSYTVTAENKKKTVKKEDLESAISNNEHYAFLKDSVDL